MEVKKKNRDQLIQEIMLLRDRVAHLEAQNTSYKSAENVPLEDEELYRAVVENIADGIAITVNTERVFVNKAFLTIHGLREVSEVVGHPLDQFVVPED